MHSLTHIYVFQVYSLTFFVNAVESLYHRGNYKNILFQLTETTDETFRIKFKEKMQHLKRKYGIIISLMLLFHIVATIAHFDMTLRQTVTTTNYDIFAVLRIYQYIIVTDVIRSKLEILHEYILAIDLSEKRDWNVLKGKLVVLKQAYQHILGTVMMFNQSTGYSLLSLIMLLITGFICVTFWILLSLLKNLQVISIIGKK